MRTFVQLLIFALVVGAIAAAIAPPLGS